MTRITFCTVILRV